jgi:hypothetical protein
LASFTARWPLRLTVISMPLIVSLSTRVANAFWLGRCSG